MLNKHAANLKLYSIERTVAHAASIAIAGRRQHLKITAVCIAVLWFGQTKNNAFL